MTEIQDNKSILLYIAAPLATYVLPWQKQNDAALKETAWREMAKNKSNVTDGNA